eukprot:529985-Pelagomonas_calceolata.AAC.6
MLQLPTGISQSTSFREVSYTRLHSHLGCSHSFLAAKPQSWGVNPWICQRPVKFTLGCVAT